MNKCRFTHIFVTNNENHAYNGVIMGDKVMKTITTYAEFWPYYLREHSKASTRGWHYFGTFAAISVLIAIIATANWKLLPLSCCLRLFLRLDIPRLLSSVIEPTTFTYPLWSLYSDFKMLFCFLTGRIGSELDAAGVARTA